MTRLSSLALPLCSGWPSSRVPLRCFLLSCELCLFAMLLFAFGAAPARAQEPLCSNLPPGIVSWWRAETNAQDAVGVNTSTSLNGTTFAPGKVGQAFSFNYSTNYIPVPTNGLNVGTGDFTIEGWIKTTSTKEYNAILDYDSFSPALYVRGSGVLQFYPHPASTAGFFNDGQFHHFAVARLSGQINYYKDGLAAGTVPGATPMNAQNIYIGTDPAGGEQFVGLIDELTFYNRALSSNEVQHIYAQSSGGKCGTVTNTPAPTNAVADYRFQNTHASSVGNPPALQPINSPDGSGFVNATVDGSPRTVLGFPLGRGLSLAPTTGLIASNEYSVVMLMRFDFVSSYRRILNVYAATSDEGLYTHDGLLQYYGGGYQGVSPSMAPTQWVQVVFTRSAGNFIAGYVDGVSQFSGAVSAGNVVIGANNSLRFFKDNTAEDSSGQVARIRLFNSALTPDEVAALDRSPPPTPGSPDIALSATNLNFGTVTVGNGTNLALTVSNIGASTLTITSLTTNNSAFQVVSPATPFNVATGAQAVVTLRFSPASSGSQTGAVAIASNDPDAPTLAVRLAGSGNAPDIALSATNLNFGNVTVGNGTNLTLTVSNAGTSTLTITSLTTNHPAFRVVSPATPFNVAIGAQVSVTLRFTPTLVGLQNGDLSIASNDPDEATLAVGLSGTGVSPPPGPPDIALSATNLNFGYVTIGSSSNLTLTVSNVGGTTLTVTSLATNHPAFAVLSPATPFNVIGGTQAVVTLRFSPTSAGALTGAVSIASNASNKPNVSVSLSGSGLAGVPGIASITPMNATPGSSVTISGTNFGASANGVVVWFGSHSGVIQSITSTQIVVRVPLAVSGSVSAAVTVNGQTSDEFAFQVQAPTSSLRITEVSLTTTDSVRLLTQPVWPNPDELRLESSDSPLGPWWKEIEAARNNAPTGQEFFTPHRAYYPQRFFRVAASPSATLPYIRFLAPNQNVRPGLSVTLFGANFSPTPAENTVRFELPVQSWNAVVTAAASNYLTVTVPPNLLTTTWSTGLLYRVTVTTSQGTGNGVGCAVFPTTANAFSLRPSETIILQPPGSGTEVLVAGGGVPPYSLVPQTSNELAVAVATLTGPIVTVVARTNINFGGLTVRVQDSSVPPQQASAKVSVRPSDFAPEFTAAFHTLLAGTAPGLTMTARFYDLQPEQMELRLQNAQIELTNLHPGAVLGLVRLYYSSSAYGFQQIVINEVNAGRATFDVISLDGSGVETIARGELIQNPPTLVINALNQKATTVMPTTVDQEIIFSDSVFRLPATAGQSFSITANFTSVSAHPDQYVPLRSAATTNFTTTGVAVGAPRLERVLPVHGEVRRNARLLGTGFDPNPTNNHVTFAGVENTRVPANVLLQTNGDLYVTVPRGAISGPMRIEVGGQTGNDFSFFVRFHPDTVLIFAGLTNNTPAAPRFIHQQPVDEDETIGEVPLQSVTATLDQGRLALTGVIFNQQVGAVFLVNYYTGRSGTNAIIYKGQEQPAPQRHIFEVRASSFVLARIYALDDADGSGVVFQIEGGTGIFQFNAGIMWDYQFTTPIYRPPATAGTDMNVRLEAVSQKWRSIPGSEMRIILNSTERVQ